MASRQARTVILALAAVALAALMGATGAAAKGTDGTKAKISIESLSTVTDQVSGEDALVGITLPAGMKAADLRVLANGSNVTAAFAPANASGKQQSGLVDGLRQGYNRLVAFSTEDAKDPPPAELELYDRPLSGPMFSGPWQLPFACKTTEAGLGASTQPSCMIASKVEYQYMSTGGTFKPLANPATRPADLAQTKTRDGKTVDFVVRIESGTINRAIYRFAVLAPGGDPLAGWSRRMVYTFGGSCNAGHEQGDSAIGQVLDEGHLAQGYATLASSLTNFKTACNDVLSAETAAMVKEHAIEELGAAPLWTMGNGGSGGSIQQQMMVQNYPGILDGILPGNSFPDNSLNANADCELLNTYFASPKGQTLTDEQRMAITGLDNPDGCLALGRNGDSIINASEGCQESQVGGAGLIYDPVTNPGGFRCSIFDSLVNVLGTSPATGKPLRALDNVGVQYGLAALNSGAISLTAFLNLNQAIGGFNDDGVARPARSVADPQALPNAYVNGRINRGAGGTPDVPIVDMREYVDDQVNVHLYVNTFNFRQRLLATNGTFANQVMFRAAEGNAAKQMRPVAQATLANWMDRIAADHSDRSQAEKVIADKPADAVDACWTPAGTRVNEPAVVSGTGTCADLYSPHRLPDQAAGKPIGSIVIKCQLKPIVASDYGSPSANQLARLHAIFPGGVCDYSKPGVGQQPLGGTWRNYGPDRADPRGRKLKLEAKKVAGKGKGRSKGKAGSAKSKLVAAMKPCPEANRQKVVFERRANGKWRRLGSAYTEGGSCKASLEAKLKGAKKVRATAAAGPGYEGAKDTAKTRGR